MFGAYMNDGMATTCSTKEHETRATDAKNPESLEE
jgi:hypothetical protein